MDHDPLGRQQVVHHRLAGQLVHEPQLLRSSLSHQPARQQRSEMLADRSSVPSNQCPQKRDVHVPADDRGPQQRLPVRRLHRLQPDLHRPIDAQRQAWEVSVIDDVVNELLDIERHAVADFDQPREPVGRQRLIENRPGHLGDAIRAETVEAHLLDRSKPLQPRNQILQPRRHLVVAEGRKQTPSGSRGSPSQVHDGLEGDLVGPVQILQHHQDRFAAPENTTQRVERSATI